MTARRLAFERASFGYGREPVLADIDLELRPGELVGVLGANGSGKTTLVRGATRLLDAAAGRVLLDGRPIGELSRREIARTVAVVPQDRVPVFSYTVLETVLMGRTPWLRPFSFEGDADVRIAEAALEAVGLGDRAHRTMQHLSGGERQRAIVARALAQQTPLMLADEPTAHLDLRHAVEIFALLARLCAERDLGVMLITHDLNLAAAHCDTVVLLGSGRVIARGPAAEVLTPELLSAAFETRIEVLRHASGAPLIVPQL